MLVRRRPREVYRVYSEEEYLNGAGSELRAVRRAAVDGERPASATSRARGRRDDAGWEPWASVGGVVVLNVARAHTSAGRGPEKLVAARVRGPCARRRSLLPEWRRRGRWSGVRPRQRARSLERNSAPPRQDQVSARLAPPLRPAPWERCDRRRLCAPSPTARRPRRRSLAATGTPGAAPPARDASERSVGGVRRRNQAEFGFER